MQITDGAVAWNALLTAGYAILIYFVRGKFDEITELRSLLAATREDIARNSITRTEFSDGLKSVMDRIDNLSAMLAKDRRGGGA